MPKIHGKITAQKKRFGIVVSRFNEFITKRLLDSAVETLVQAGAKESYIDIVWAPGALEVPFFCSKMAKSKAYDAIIALACVLRGDTFHFETVSHEVTRGVSQVSMENDKPIASGIITADTLDQAIDRAGLKAGNKGGHAALAALEIADANITLNKRIKRIKKRGKAVVRSGASK